MPTTFFYWVKVSNARRSNSPFPSGTVTQGELNQLTQLAIAQAIGTNGTCTDNQSWGHPVPSHQPLLLAAAFNGVKSSDSWIDHSQLHETQAVAVTWLAANQAWLAGAATYALMSVELLTQTEIDARIARLQSLTWLEPQASWIANKLAEFQGCTYSVPGWEQKFSHLATPMNSLLALNCLDNFDCPMPDGSDECATLLALQQSRTREQEAEITLEAASLMDSLWPVQRLLGDPHGATIGSPLPCKPATIALIAELIDALQWPLFALKRIFNRGRPGTCCTGASALNPMFTGTPLEPKHPSFPSAHACNAYALALVLNAIRPIAGSTTPGPSAYEEAALKVAKNREIAGVHYPSDSAAGVALAKHLVGQLMAPGNTQFSQLLTAAQAEW